MVEQRNVHSEVVGSIPTLAKIQFPYYAVGRIKRIQKLFGVYSPVPICFRVKREIVLQSIEKNHQGKMLAIIKMCSIFGNS